MHCILCPELNHLLLINNFVFITYNIIMKILKDITLMEDDFSQWYTDVVINGKLFEYGPIKGTSVFMPNGYGIWEKIQTHLNSIFKSYNIQNVYLPLLIPSTFIEREKQHIKGFKPELATVTHVGNSKLSEPIVIRPTSEVLFADLFSKIVSSYNNLPILFNQWANVFRWEKTTRPFLRTSEFLWQEGHSVHADAKSAKAIARTMIRIYYKFLKNYLAIPTIMGKKTSREKFAGAKITFTIEAMTKDGKALQSGTSHYLGQEFSKAFNILFNNANNEHELGYQSSWGVSTRLIGAMVMVHGDNRGVIIPPKIAPTQIDILEIFADQSPHVRDFVHKIAKQLKRKFRIQIDTSNKRPGYKVGESEIKGTPVRIEVGPRDLDNKEVLITRRDTLEKYLVKISKVKKFVDKLLIEIQENLYKKAFDQLQSNVVTSYTYNDLKTNLGKNKFVITPFVGSSIDEEWIQEDTNGGTVRCIPSNWPLPKVKTKCILTGKPTKRYVLFAKAY